MTTSGQDLLDRARTDIEVVREEMLFRLGAQQNIINYTFVVLGAMAAILGVSADNFKTDGIVIVLLTIPILCTFLQGVYLKHQLYIEIIAQYITNEIYPKVIFTNTEEQYPYRRWELYLASVLSRKQTRFLAIGLGAAEATFPIIVGILCLIIYPAVGTAKNPITHAWFFSFWYCIDMLLLVSVTFALIAVRIAIQKRQKEVSQRMPPP